MTSVGLITFAGLMAVLGYVSTHPTAATVKHLWGFLFLLFLLVTASYRVGLSPVGHAAAYALPAISVAIWTVLKFRSWEGGAIAALMLMNILGNLVGVDVYKFLTVDALDAFTWAQIGLLLVLARKTPVEKNATQSAPAPYEYKEHKRLRVISGGLRDPRPAKT